MRNRHLLYMFRKWLFVGCWLDKPEFRQYLGGLGSLGFIVHIVDTIFSLNILEQLCLCRQKEGFVKEPLPNSAHKTTL